MAALSTPFFVSYGFLWILVGFQTLVLMGLVRTVYRLQLGGGTHPLYGRSAPTFKAETITGVSIQSRDYANRMRAVLFVSPDCPTCAATFQEVEALRWKTTGNVIVVCRGDLSGCRLLAEEHDLTVPVIADEDSALSELFEIPGVPTAVLINEQNLIQSYGYPQRDELERVLGAPGVGEHMPA